jgi:hypothetical protein
MTNYFVQDSTGPRVAKLQKILNPRTRDGRGGAASAEGKRPPAASARDSRRNRA